MAVKQQNLTEVEITLKEIPVRDTETDKEVTAWKVDHPNLDRPCKGETPREALDLFGSCIEKKPSDEISINLNRLSR